MKRREFVKKSGLVSSLLLVPSFLKAWDESSSSIGNYKKLVIIQLSGGNDGLNTIVPYNNDIYFRKRKTIAQKKSQLLSLNDELGFHESMSAFKDLYDQGFVTILSNVGYPNPVRSHFRSTDIWHTASASNQYLQTGWIGRFLEKKLKSPLGAIEVDDTLSLLMKGENLNGIAVKNAKLFHRITQDPYFSNVLKSNTDAHLSEHNLGYLYKTVLDAKSSARYIYEKTRTFESKTEYPKNAFGKQLKTISEFINSGLKTKVYYASLGGFDTHANQINAQKRLLKVYSDGISAFIKDLRATDAFKDTIVLTFSEFGRRLNQNAANGTDHGAANLVFLMGDNLKRQGIYNSPSDLTNLDENGDIIYEIDFRSIYTSLLKDWLDTEPSLILDEDFKPLELLV